MGQEYEILQTWVLTDGPMAEIKFASLKRPQSGSTITYNNKVYKIKGIVSHMTPSEANIQMIERMKEGIYDCFLKPVE